MPISRCRSSIMSYRKTSGDILYVGSGSDQPAPLPRRAARGERLGTDLVHVIAPRLLAPDDLPCVIDAFGVVDDFALAADSELGHPARR